jgi:hypothetical protein
MPVFLYGTGTPNNIEPFNGAGVGSTYTETNATARNPNVWVKVGDTNAIADWVLPGSTGIVSVMSHTEINISDGDSEQLMFNAVTASEVLEIGLLWTEATDASGADSGDITVGISSGNGDIVSAANGAYAVSKAIGDYQALTISDGELVAGESIFFSHDIVAEAGIYYVLAKIRVEA